MDMDGIQNEPSDAFPSFDSNSAQPPDSPNAERRPGLQLGNTVAEYGEHSLFSSVHAVDTVITNTNFVGPNWEELGEMDAGGLQNGQTSLLDTPPATEHDLQQELQEQED